MAGDSLESNFMSIKPAVEFIGILDQYSYNEDFYCSYKFNDYTPKEGDRIAIFKLGWNFVKDYVVFEWVPIDSENKEHTVVFNKHILPKNINEIYQTCYINGENILHGASLPFQFASEVSNLMTQSVVSSIASVESACSKSARFDEVHKLKEENEMLRASLKAIIAQNSRKNFKNYDSEISDLKNITNSLKEALTHQQEEINMLKMKITIGGEEYKKLYLEKVKIEKKYDKLKNKIEGTEKSVPESVNFDIADLKSIPPFPFAK